MFISLVELEQLPVYVIWNYEIVNTKQDITLPNVFSSAHIHTQWLLHRLHHVGKRWVHILATTGGLRNRSMSALAPS